MAKGESVRVKEHTQLITELSFVPNSKAIHQKQLRKKKIRKGQPMKREREEREKYVLWDLCSI